MKMLGVLASLVLLVGMMGGVRAQQAQAAGDAVWKNDMAERRAELLKRNGTGTDAALRDKLVAMYASDQEARGAGTGKAAYTAKTAAVDLRLTAELKEIVARHGWPVIAMVGIEASNDAMNLLVHSPDHAWQLSLVPKLERLAAESKIDGSALATLVDKELVSEGKLQRYGTQFKFVDGKMAMYAVEDPAGLDARRAMVFQVPIREYEEILEKAYRLKLSDQVVAPK
jgi:hypothetical protein